MGPQRLEHALRACQEPGEPVVHVDLERPAPVADGGGMERKRLRRRGWDGDGPAEVGHPVQQRAVPAGIHEHVDVDREMRIAQPLRRQDRTLDKQAACPSVSECTLEEGVRKVQPIGSVWLAGARTISTRRPSWVQREPRTPVLGLEGG